LTTRANWAVDNARCYISLPNVVSLLASFHTHKFGPIISSWGWLK